MPTLDTADPWLQSAFDYFMSNVGPKRTRRIGSYGGDLQSRLNYALNLGHNDELAMYNTWLQNNPRPPATPSAPTTPTADPNAPVSIDPARMAMAKQAALNKADLHLRSLGLDPTQYIPLISAEFDKVASSASLQKDPYSVFSDDITTSVVNAEKARRTGQFSKEYENVFGTAADQQAAPSSLLDDAINSILTQQRGVAQQQLDRGKARGIYNDVGYNAGLSAIDTAMATGRSSLGSLGSGLINTYRGGLDEIGNKAYNAASSVGFDPTFSLDPYISEYNDYVGRTRNNAAGDLRGALGNTNFFDLSNIRSAAGTAQGALNLRDTDVATALQERRRTQSARRGLGSQGAF